MTLLFKTNLKKSIKFWIYRKKIFRAYGQNIVTKCNHDCGVPGRISHNDMLKLIIFESLTWKLTLTLTSVFYSENFVLGWYLGWKYFPGIFMALLCMYGRTYIWHYGMGRMSAKQFKTFTSQYPQCTVSYCF